MPGWPSGSNDVVADGVHDHLGQRVEVQLKHDVGAVSFGRIDADVEETGDFLVALAFGEELEDLPFAWCQA